MTSFRKITVAARFSLAAIAALAFAPAAAAARDCASEQIQCIAEYGSGSFCLHEYIDCLSGAILDY